MRPKQWRPWSAEELAQATAWRDEGTSDAEIGKRLGRTRQAIALKLWTVAGTRRFHILHGNNDPVTDERIVAERDARREASYRRSLTQQLFGDPPIGFSALDKRRPAHR
jgi:hypothetical protein